MRFPYRALFCRAVLTVGARRAPHAVGKWLLRSYDLALIAEELAAADVQGSA